MRFKVQAIWQYAAQESKPIHWRRTEWKKLIICEYNNTEIGLYEMIKEGVR